jgi:hypothetical protein
MAVADPREDLGAQEARLQPSEGHTSQASSRGTRAVHRFTPSPNRQHPSHAYKNRKLSSEEHTYTKTNLAN